MPDIPRHAAGSPAAWRRAADESQRRAEARRAVQPDRRLGREFWRSLALTLCLILVFYAFVLAAIVVSAEL